MKILEYVFIFSLFFLPYKYLQKPLISSKGPISSLPWGLQLLIQEHSNNDKKARRVGEASERLWDFKGLIRNAISTYCKHDNNLML